MQQATTEAAKAEAGRLDDLARQRQELVIDQQRSVMAQLGLDDTIIAEELGRRKKVRELGRRSADLFGGSRPDPDAGRKDLVTLARRRSSAGGRVFLKPDPFAPVDVVTDGPYIDYDVPGATVEVCDRQLLTIVETAAGLGADISPDGVAEDLITHTEEFDETPGVNRSEFTLHAGGETLTDRLTFAYLVGPQFHFTPTVTGRYAFAPVARLSGSWLAGDLSALGGGGASIKVSLRTFTSQFGATEFGPDDWGYAYDETVLVEDRVSGGAESGTFDHATPADGNGPMVSRQFEGGQLVRIYVKAVVNVSFTRLGFVDVAAAKGLGLEVPEVHAFQLNCFDSPIDHNHDLGRVEDGPPVDLGDPHLPGRPPFRRDVRR